MSALRWWAAATRQVRQVRRTVVFALSRTSGPTLLFACILASQTATAGESRPSTDTHAEAAFLIRLVPFIDWPLDAFSTPESPLIICAAATDPLARRFAEATGNESVGKRPIRLRVISALDVADACHILYPGSQNEAAVQIAKTLGHRPVLTVSRSMASTYETAMIAFTLDHDRIRFDVDNATAVGSRLVISSKLLALAHNVSPRS